MIIEKYRLTLTHTLTDDTAEKPINIEQPLIVEYHIVPFDNQGYPVPVNYIINRLCRELKDAVITDIAPQGGKEE